MLPTPAQIRPLALILALLTAFVASSCLLRHFLDRETAANVEAGVVIGVVVVVFVVGFLRKG